MPRLVIYKVAYSGVFATQSAIGTPLLNSQIDTAVTFIDGSQSYIDIPERTEDVWDCTTQYPKDDILLNRHGQLTLRIEVDGPTLAGWFKLWGGASSSSPYQMLPPTTFTLPATTLILGFADGVDTGMVFRDVGVESIVITGQVNQKFQTTIVLVGSGALPDASGYSFPECTSITPLRLDNSTSIMMNSVEYKDIVRSFELSMVNNIDVSSSAFPLAGVDLTKLERGDKRPIMFKTKILGTQNDSNGLAARANPRTHWPLALTIGNLTFEVADAMVKKGSPFGDTSDDTKQSALNLLLVPTKVAGDASTPLQLTVS